MNWIINKLLSSYYSIVAHEARGFAWFSKCLQRNFCFCRLRPVYPTFISANHSKARWKKVSVRARRRLRRQRSGFWPRKRLLIVATDTKQVLNEVRDFGPEGGKCLRKIFSVTLTHAHQRSFIGKCLFHSWIAFLRVFVPSWDFQIPKWVIYLYFRHSGNFLRRKVRRRPSGIPTKSLLGKWDSILRISQLGREFSWAKASRGGTKEEVRGENISRIVWRKTK